MMSTCLRIIFLLWFANYHAVLAQVTIPNADFETSEKSTSTGTAFWQTEGSLESCFVDKRNAFEGACSMKLTKSSLQGTGRFYQEIPFTTATLKKYKVSAAIKVQNVNEGYAGVSVRVLDNKGRLVCHQNLNMTPFKINKTKDWTIYEGEFYVPPATEKLKVAGYIWGSGEAWFDNIQINEIPFSKEKLTPIIANYIDEYFGIIRSKTIVKDSSYIEQLYRDAQELCKGNSDIHYCHFILKNITFNLNDGHSFFSTPEERSAMHKGDKNLEHGEAGFATGKMLGNNIAYIYIPTFASLDWDLVKQAVDSLHKIIEHLDIQQPNGWIIDLSECNGGNSFAMFPGLGPLLGNGICGYSISADGSKKSLVYRDGSAGWDDDLESLIVKPYSVKNPNLPIAVLVGKQTGSSGEVTALTFRGMNNSKSFGQETGGYTTRVDNYVMSDGASINLASGFDADRNGVVFYGTKIPPDVVTRDHDESLLKAVSWILN